MASDPFEQHRAILKAAQALLDAVRRNPSIEIHELNRLRTRLATLIHAHRKTEEEEIFAPLFQNGGMARLPQLKADLEHNKREKSRYSEIVRQWTPQAIAADRAGYVATLAERIGQLQAMIRFEEERIYRPILELKAKMGSTPIAKAS